MPSERASECARRVPLQGRSSLDCGPNTSQIQARLDDNTPHEPAASLQDQAQDLAAHERLFDNLFTRLRNAIITDEAVRTDAQRRRLSLVELDGLLWHEGHRLYIPDKDQLRQDILFWHHDVPWMAHLGAQRCIAMMISQYYWPNMRADIANYVKTCVQCQSNKPDRRRNVPALSPLVPPSSCWRTLGVDLITELPMTVSGFNSVCVFVCHLSKMVRLVPTTSRLDAVGFAKLFIREIFTHYGFPLTIVSDRGPQWNNEFFRAMCDRAGVRLTLSTAFHPQTNGLVERTNEVVAAALRHYVTADLDNWDEYLPLVEFALNSSYHDAIKTTPFRMNRITVPANPFEVLLDHTWEASTEQAGWLGVTPMTHKANRTYVEAHAEFQRARRCVHAAKSKMKDRHDSKGILPHLYSVGDFVWFNIRNIGLRHDSRRHKLLPKYWGPYKILELVGTNAVRLDMPTHLSQIHPVVSIQLVKPYYARDNQSLPPMIINDEPEYEVESIVNFNLLRSKRRNGPTMVEFRVRWKGGYQDSWHEPIDFENATDSLVAYLRQLTVKQRVAVLKAFDSVSLERLPNDLRVLLI
jgi:hypothetical protein